jgi:zinc transporter 1/2/3
MHAAIQFDNPCLGELQYEGTVMAIAMGGAFIAFLVDYTGLQYLRRKQRLELDRFGNEHAKVAGLRIRHIHLDKSETAADHIEDINIDSDRMMRLEAMRKSSNEEERLGVMIMEGGIIFHSICMFFFEIVRESAKFKQWLVYF